MSVLVTGATGFIGGHLARRLVGMGHTVRALVRSSAPGLEREGVELVSGDLTRPETLTAAMEGVRGVFHLASLRDHWGVPLSTYRTVNTAGTCHLLAAAMQAGVERFVYCSSVGVARYPGRIDADEMLPYVEPTSQVAYHRTKMDAERLVLVAARAGALPAVVVRPVITYGPGDETGMVTRLLVRLARGRFLPVGDGRNHVDLAYVDDVVGGMVRAWERGAVGRAYILSGPRPVTMREVLIAARAALGKPGPGRVYLPTGLARLLAGWAERAWGALHRRPPVTRDAVATLTVDRGFSHARATAELGYVPQVGLEEGMRRTVDWLQGTGRIAKGGRGDVGRGRMAQEKRAVPATGD